MFEDFDLGGFLDGVNSTVSQVGNIKNSVDSINAGSQSTNVSTAVANKYQNIQQQTVASTATKSPLDNKMLIFGGVGLVALVLIMKR